VWRTEQGHIYRISAVVAVLQHRSYRGWSHLHVDQRKLAGSGVQQHLLEQATISDPAWHLKWGLCCECLGSVHRPIDFIFFVFISVHKLRQSVIKRLSSRPWRSTFHAHTKKTGLWSKNMKHFYWQTWCSAGHQVCMVLQK
jgi:hypothetical protein